MKEKVEFSIIVPVYNIENYITECIESIITQTYQNFELILVDDESTDKSGEICDMYAKMYSKIKVIHKKNGGLSSARNSGIDNSNGEYLMFIDGDDKLYKKDNLESLNSIIIQKKADIIFYKMIYWYDKKYKFNNKKYSNIYKDKIDIINNLNKIGLLSVSACDKIVKRDLIIKNALYFQDGLLSEDIHWSYKLYLLAQKFYHTNLNIYVYRQQRTGSISMVKSEKSLSDLYYIINYWLNYNYDSDKMKNTYYNLISYWYLIIRTNYSKKIYNSDMLKRFKKMDKYMLNYNNNYKVRLAYITSKFFGTNISLSIMRLYIFLKNKGLVKI